MKTPIDLRTKNSRRFYGLVFLSTLVSLVLIFIFINVLIEELSPPRPITIGATFSSQYATSLGLDWKKTFTAVADDLNVRLFRIPAYWEDIEPTKGSLNFNDLDWIINEAGKRKAKILLAVGFKLPRWPECHAPSWVYELDVSQRKTETLRFLRILVDRYKGNDSIIAWQVENEPLFENFGICPAADREFLKQEVSLVRSLDNRKIVVTESGELSTWLQTATISDILGISMYRVAWNKYLGYIYYPLSSSFYRRKANAVRPLTKRLIVTELQAEPWVPQGILNASLDEQFRSMNPSRLRDNILFVQKTGFSDVYLWGIEWWYWLKEKQNNSSMWDIGKAVFNQSLPPPSNY